MKIINVSVSILFFLSLTAVAQNKVQEEWNNHDNYKEVIIENLKNYPVPYYPNEKTLDAYYKSNETAKQSSFTYPEFQFVNGINIAWVNYGRDIGRASNGTEYHPNMDSFKNIINSVSASGGNVIRWWYHTNGSTNPIFDQTTGLVITNPSFFETDLKLILDYAATKNIKIQICLWSFDMLKGGQWNVNSARNKRILTEDIALQSYLDNALIPLVNSIGNHSGLYAWEIFNEPEGMTTEYASNWPDFTDRVSIVDIQKVVNKIASAIRTSQPNVKITNGALGFLSGLNNSSFNYYNNYTNQRLQDKGGKINGYLDFYNIHYYSWAGTNGSPFHTNFNSSMLDKPTVIAEYYPQDTFGVLAEDLASTLINKGWNGSLLWSWSDRGWNALKPIIEKANTSLSLKKFELNEVSIFPNPTIDEITIKGLPSYITKAYISDIYGKILKVEKVESNLPKISFTTYAKGIYFISFDDTNSTAQRVIKN